MAVEVKHWKSAYWLFINHNGKRKARRVGAGPAGQRAANVAAIKIQARLAEGDTGLFEESPTVEPPTTFRTRSRRDTFTFSSSRAFSTGLSTISSIPWKCH